MLPKDLKEIEQSLLEEICRESWAESPTLEFKATLPDPAGDKGKQEFLKDVAALANAAGGDLVFGIATKKDRANAVLPISDELQSSDAIQRRLGQWLESGIEPRVPLSMRPVAVKGGYVLIVRVPASFLKPHRSRVASAWQWPARNGTHTTELPYSQIRALFDRTNTLSDRARRFREERLAGVLAGTTGRPLKEGPRQVVHFIPLQALSREMNVDVRALYNDGFAQFSYRDWGGATRSFNLDGLAVYPGQRTAHIAYTQVFRSGCLEAARYVGALNAPDNSKVISSGTLSDHVRDSIDKFLTAHKEWKTYGPGIVAIALLDITGWSIAYQARDYMSTLSSADRPHLILPEVWVDDIATATLDTLARPLLDILWQAFDLETCPFYEADGSWQRH